MPTCQCSRNQKRKAKIWRCLHHVDRAINFFLFAPPPPPRRQRRTTNITELQQNNKMEEPQQKAASSRGRSPSQLSKRQFQMMNRKPSRQAPEWAFDDDSLDEIMYEAISHHDNDSATEDESISSKESAAEYKPRAVRIHIDAPSRDSTPTRPNEEEQHQLSLSQVFGESLESGYQSLQEHVRVHIHIQAQEDKHERPDDDQQGASKTVEPKTAPHDKAKQDNGKVDEKPMKEETVPETPPHEPASEEECSLNKFFQEAGSLDYSGTETNSIPQETQNTATVVEKLELQQNRGGGFLEMEDSLGHIETEAKAVLEEHAQEPVEDNSILIKKGKKATAEEGDDQLVSFDALFQQLRILDPELAALDEQQRGIANHEAEDPFKALAVAVVQFVRHLDPELAKKDEEAVQQGDDLDADKHLERTEQFFRDEFARALLAIGHCQDKLGEVASSCQDSTRSTLAVSQQNLLEAAVYCQTWVRSMVRQLDPELAAADERLAQRAVPSHGGQDDVEFAPVDSETIDMEALDVALDKTNDKEGYVSLEELMDEMQHIVERCQEAATKQLRVLDPELAAMDEMAAREAILAV